MTKESNVSGPKKEKTKYLYIYAYIDDGAERKENK